MKKKVEMTLLDITFTKLAVFLSSSFLIGLLATYWPFQVIIFLRENKWYLLIAALIVAIPPMKRFFSCEEKKKATKLKKKTRSKKK